MPSCPGGSAQLDMSAPAGWFTGVLPHTAPVGGASGVEVIAALQGIRSFLSATVHGAPAQAVVRACTAADAAGGNVTGMRSRRSRTALTGQVMFVPGPLSARAAERRHVVIVPTAVLLTLAVVTVVTFAVSALTHSRALLITGGALMAVTEAWRNGGPAAYRMWLSWWWCRRWPAQPAQLLRDRQVLVTRVPSVVVRRLGPAAVPLAAQLLNAGYAGSVAELIAVCRYATSCPAEEGDTARRLLLAGWTGTAADLRTATVGILAG